MHACNYNILLNKENMIFLSCSALKYSASPLGIYSLLCIVLLLVFDVFQLTGYSVNINAIGLSLHSCSIL